MPQNGAESVNTDYLFLISTEHFGTVGVGVGDNVVRQLRGGE